LERAILPILMYAEISGRRQSRCQGHPLPVPGRGNALAKRGRPGGKERGQHGEINKKKWGSYSPSDWRSFGWQTVGGWEKRWEHPVNRLSQVGRSLPIAKNFSPEFEQGERRALGAASKKSTKLSTKFFPQKVETGGVKKGARGRLKRSSGRKDEGFLLGHSFRKERRSESPKRCPRRWEKKKREFPRANPPPKKRGGGLKSVGREGKKRLKKARTKRVTKDEARLQSTWSRKKGDGIARKLDRRRDSFDTRRLRKGSLEKKVERMRRHLALGVGRSLWAKGRKAKRDCEEEDSRSSQSSDLGGASNKVGKDPILKGNTIGVFRSGRSPGRTVRKKLGPEGSRGEGLSRGEGRS